jgi:hypothetical protein
VWRLPKDRDVSPKVYSSENKLRSDFLVFALQYSLKCSKCGTKGPFRISVVDQGRAGSGDDSHRAKHA